MTKRSLLTASARCTRLITRRWLRTRTLSAFVSGRPQKQLVTCLLKDCPTVEFTPQAFLQSDLDMFFAYVPPATPRAHGLSDVISPSNFSPSQVGTTPDLISIDGGVAQTTQQGFNFNGESALDLEYAFGLTNPQPILLLQTGDLVEGTWKSGSGRLSMSDPHGSGASFNNWLDAVDGSFCTFEGGDDPTQVSTSATLTQSSYDRDSHSILNFRTESTPTRNLAGLTSPSRVVSSHLHSWCRPRTARAKVP